MISDVLVLDRHGQRIVSADSDKISGILTLDGHD